MEFCSNVGNALPLPLQDVAADEASAVHHDRQAESWTASVSHTQSVQQSCMEDLA